MKRKNIVIALLAVGAIATLSFRSPQDEDWPVPPDYKNMKNPVQASVASIGAGSALYTKHCASCHGPTGHGDGPKASKLKGIPADLTDSDFNSQSDGSIFYKISKGRDEMPAYKNKLAGDNDIWSLVNYLRTMKK